MYMEVYIKYIKKNKLKKHYCFKILWNYIFSWLFIYKFFKYLKILKNLYTKTLINEIVYLHNND